MMFSIGESELIITPEGAIYHLDLRPEQLADTIITVGDPARVAAISQYFDRVDYKVQHREFITHTGWIGKKRISVVSTGIGPDNIDIVLNELDALVNIDFTTRTIKDQQRSLQIIRLGTSGSLQASIPTDSLVVADFGIGLDNLIHFYQLENNVEELELLSKFEAHTMLENARVRPYIASSSRMLSNHFQQGYYHGITLTCPGFYGPQGRVLRASLAYKHLIDSFTTFKHSLPITNFEMETSAIYGLGKILKHHCLSINTIIANRGDKTFTKNATAAIDNMIQRSLAIIEKL